MSHSRTSKEFKQYPKCWSTSTISDWAIILVLLIIELLLHTEVHPHNQCIPGKDPSCTQNSTAINLQLNYPIMKSTVPFQVIVAVFPLLFICIFIINFFILQKTQQRKKRSKINSFKIFLYKLEIIVRILLITISITFVITTGIKRAVGRPRPNFNQNSNEYDRRLSFPSGHASFSWSILFLLTLYLLHSLQNVRKLKYSIIAFNERAIIDSMKDSTSEDEIYQQLSSDETNIKSNEDIIEEIANDKRKMSVNLPSVRIPSLNVDFNERSDVKECKEMQLQSIMNHWNGDAYFGLFLWIKLSNHCLLCIIIALLPTFIAIYVSCTRLTDYKHHYSDVLCGSFIGISIASVIFFVYKNEYYFGYRYRFGHHSQYDNE